MSLLSEVCATLDSLCIQHETGAFIDNPPDTFAVLTPMSDDWSVIGDSRPLDEIQNLRISLFTKGNYLADVRRIVFALLDAEIVVSDRRYVGREDDSGYSNFAVDCLKPVDPHSILG
jgi:hypothetical protein